MSKQLMDSENKQILEKINVPMDIGSVKAFCETLVTSDFFLKVKEGGMLKNLEFKENKCINGMFSIDNKKEVITIS